MSICITVENLTKRFGAHAVIENLSITVNEGEIVVFRGPSGVGKSTFLRCLTYLEPFDGGRVLVGDQELRAGMDVRHHRAAITRVREQLGFVFQFFNLFPHLTVLDNLTLGPVHVLGESRAAAEAAARVLLGRVGLADRADSFPLTLSGGQLQRVSIARALAMRPRALLLDEPTSSLDPDMKGEIVNVIHEFRGETTMLIVTHEPAFVETIATRRVTFGPACAILSDTAVTRAQ